MRGFDIVDVGIFVFIAGGICLALLLVAAGIHSDYRGSQSFVACVEAGHSPAECEVVR